MQRKATAMFTYSWLRSALIVLSCIFVNPNWIDFCTAAASQEQVHEYKQCTFKYLKTWYIRTEGNFRECVFPFSAVNFWSFPLWQQINQEPDPARDFPFVAQSRSVDCFHGYLFFKTLNPYPPCSILSYICLVQAVQCSPQPIWKWLPYRK